ncbi:MAG: septum formation initiator family protein [Synergistaceae bacterium]|nr:septum formation initiator family protein [Synergistaceae bacterium]
MFSLKRIVIFALCVLGLAITWSYYRFELDRIAQIREQISRSEVVLKQKRDSVRDYKEKVAFYKTQEGIEHLAREQYNLVGNGERVILLRSEDVQQAPPEIAEPSQELPHE